jgi:hypothetical protein
MKQKKEKELWLMTFQECLDNDIIETGDVIAFQGKSWKEKIEKSENQYYNHIGMAYIDEDKKLNLYQNTFRKGVHLVPLSGKQPFLVIKTGFSLNENAKYIIEGLIGTKYSFVNSFLSIFRKNNPRKLYESSLVALILNQSDYRINMIGATPTRIVECLTIYLGKKTVEVT